MLKNLRIYIANLRRRLFDARNYLHNNPDVRKAGTNPLFHYLNFEEKEGRDLNKQANEQITLSKIKNYAKTYYLYNKNIMKKSSYYIRRHGSKAFFFKIIKTLIDKFKPSPKADSSLEQMSAVMSLLLSVPSIPKVSITQPIDILVPIYNGKEFLPPLFDSIVKNTSIPYRLLLANDKSTDKSISQYLEDFKNNNQHIDNRIIQNEENLGFVKTVNKLAKLAKNHFIILNTDVEVPPYWLERLIYPILINESIASVTPFTNAGTICSFPNFLEDNLIFENMDVDILDSYFQYVDFEKNNVEIPTAVGFCMGINKNVYDKIGMFNEIFGMGYGEENDWSMRAIEAGYKNLIVPNLFVYHKHGGSFSFKEKKKLSEKHLDLLRDMHPNYLASVARFIENDPLKSLRNILKVKILADKQNPKMIIDHSLGGGANEYTENLVSNETLAIIVKFEITLKSYKIVFVGQKVGGVSFRLKHIKEVIQIIEYFKINEVRINELVGHPKILTLLDYLVEIKANNNKIRFVYMVHDFFSICPMYNLLDYKIEYCDACLDLNYCNNCLKINPLVKEQVPFLFHDYPNITVRLWRQKFKNLLDSSSEIVFFSENSREILEKTYPDLPKEKFKITPHVVDWVRPVHIGTKVMHTLNIAILGHLTVHKGVHRVASLASYIDYKKENIKIHIFGEIKDPFESFYLFHSVVEHGRYEKTDLPKHMEKNNIDIIFIPSICPETYSYTTEEAIQMKLPLAVFNLGAPAERAKKYSKGIILLEQHPEYIVDTLTRYFEENG